MPPELPAGFAVYRGTWYLIMAYVHTATGEIFLSQWGCKQCRAFVFVPGPDGISTPCFCQAAWPRDVRVYGG